MKQDLGILSFFAQKGMQSKYQSSFELPKTTTDTLIAKFGELVKGASQTVQFEAELGGNEMQALPMNDLKQQISILTEETEGLLENALEQNSGPEVVEAILFQAVTQLWNHIENFDVTNETNHVLALSEILVREGSNNRAPLETLEGARSFFPQNATQASLLGNDEPILTQVSNLLDRNQNLPKNTPKDLLNVVTMFGLSLWMNVIFYR